MSIRADIERELKRIQAVSGRGLLQIDCAAGRFEAGILGGLASVSDLLAQHFPPRAGDNPDELPNAPVVV